MGCSERVGWFALQPGGSAVLPAIPRIFADIVHAPLLSVEPMSQVVGDSVAQQRFDVILLCDSAGSHSSLASPVSIELCLISWHGKRGRLASGIVMSLAGARILGSLFFGVKPHAPVTLTTVSSLLLATGVFSAWWPARHAARVKPMEALRTE